MKGNASLFQFLKNKVVKYSHRLFEYIQVEFIVIEVFILQRTHFLNVYQIFSEIYYTEKKKTSVISSLIESK